MNSAQSSKLPLPQAENLRIPMLLVRRSGHLFSVVTVGCAKYGRTTLSLDP